MKWIRSFFSEPQTIEDVVATAVFLPYIAIGGGLWFSENGWPAGKIAYYGIGGPVLIAFIWVFQTRKRRRLSRITNDG